jgi:opacity protein-like surface antigen
VARKSPSSSGIWHSFATVLLLAVFGIAPLAKAQEEPSKLEVYAGYDYIRANANPKIPGEPTSESLNENGGSGQIAFNANNWLGLVADFSGYALARHGFATTHQISYLFGPRINLRRGRVTPFTHVLLGGVWAEDGFVLGSVTAFGMTAGGGVDISVSRHIAIRPVQAEYFLTKFSDGNHDRQNNFRFSAGIVIRLGGK